MEESLVAKLTEFGFTINQAKIYLSIVEAGLISISKISQVTELYVQDVYKILPKLENMGLITKTIDKPVLIKALPVEKALSHLVSVEKRRARQKISRLESNLKDITEKIIEHQNIMESKDENQFIPLTTDEQIRNRADVTFEKANLTCDMTVNVNLITHLTPGLKEHFELLRKAKIRMIVETNRDFEEAKKAVEKIAPRLNDFQAKIVHRDNTIPFYTIDGRELWLSMNKMTQSGLPCMIWSNSKNIVKFFHNSFNEEWENPNAVSVQISIETAKEAHS